MDLGKDVCGGEGLCGFIAPCLGSLQLGLHLLHINNIQAVNDMQQRPESKQNQIIGQSLKLDMKERKGDFGKKVKPLQLKSNFSQLALAQYLQYRKLKPYLACSTLQVVESARTQEPPVLEQMSIPAQLHHYSRTSDLLGPQSSTDLHLLHSYTESLFPLALANQQPVSNVINKAEPLQATLDSGQQSSQQYFRNQNLKLQPRLEQYFGEDKQNIEVNKFWKTKSPKFMQEQPQQYPLQRVTKKQPPKFAVVKLRTIMLQADVDVEDQGILAMKLRLSSNPIASEVAESVKQTLNLMFKKEYKVRVDSLLPLKVKAIRLQQLDQLSAIKLLYKAQI